jgi:hypothetical protein
MASTDTCTSLNGMVITDTCTSLNGIAIIYTVLTLTLNKISRNCKVKSSLTG